MYQTEAWCIELDLYRNTGLVITLKITISMCLHVLRLGFNGPGITINGLLLFLIRDGGVAFLAEVCALRTQL